MITDRGFTLGDGLFETLLADNGELADFEAHAARLARGCAVLGLADPGEARLLEAAKAALAEAGLELTRAAVRLSWTAGSGGRGLVRPKVLNERLVATAAPAPVVAGPARLITASIRRNDTSPLSRLKSLSYLDNVLARREAETAGGDEGLMLNTRGEVACATAANIFWVEGRRLMTPALDVGVLDGVVRAQLIALAPELGLSVEEVRQGPHALLGADAVFLTNSLIGTRVVESLDGRPLNQQVAQVTVLLRRGRR